MPSLPSRSRSLRVLPLLLAVLPVAPVSSQLSAVDGLHAAALVLPAPVKGWTGLDVLPTGEPVSFDGQHLVVLDPVTGAIRTTLATLPAPVFGSDVAVGPSGHRVFLAESSGGGLWVHDLVARTTHTFATLDGNFSLAFHPQEGERFLYVSARPGFTGPAKVFRVDVLTGQADLIAEASGYAGPLAFDASGGLLFAPADFSKPGIGRILRWSANQVASAIGPKHLLEHEATTFASGFDNAIDLALDGEGTVYAADATDPTSSLLEIDVNGGSRFARSVVQLAGHTLTYLAFAAGPRPFERYGSPGSRLWLLGTDFTTGRSQLIDVAPQRPALTQRPEGALAPDTPVHYRAAGLPANRHVLWLFGAGLVPERALLPLGAYGLMFPDLGIVLTAPLLVVVTSSDPHGNAGLDARAPAIKDIHWTTQVLAGPVTPLPGGTAASPWVTSNPVQAATR